MHSAVTCMLFACCTPLVGKVQPQDFLSLEPCLMLYDEIKFISQEKQKVTESKSLFEMSLISS